MTAPASLLSILPPSLDMPFRSVLTVVTSDSQNFQQVVGGVSQAVTARALWVGTGGDVEIVCPDGTVAILKNVPDGSVIPGFCIRVNVTGTSASDIVALI